VEERLKNKLKAGPGTGPEPEASPAFLFQAPIMIMIKENLK
jgi:hypothetical protein